MWPSLMLPGRCVQRKPPDWAASMDVLQSRVVKRKDPCGGPGAVSGSSVDEIQVSGAGHETLQASQAADWVLMIS